MDLEFNHASLAGVRRRDACALYRGPDHRQPSPRRRVVEVQLSLFFPTMLRGGRRQLRPTPCPAPQPIRETNGVASKHLILAAVPQSDGLLNISTSSLFAEGSRQGHFFLRFRLNCTRCISIAPAMLDRYLAALPAMSLIPFAPFFTADFLAPLFALLPRSRTL